MIFRPPDYFLRSGWSLRREYRVDGAGQEQGPVVSVSPHPGGRRLLVHTIHPVSPLKMLDLRTGSLMQAAVTQHQPVTDY